MSREELEAVVAQGAAVLQAASKLKPVILGHSAQVSAQPDDATELEPLSDKD